MPNNNSINALPYICHSDFQFLFSPRIAIDFVIWDCFHSCGGIHEIFAPRSTLYISVPTYFRVIAAIINPWPLLPTAHQDAPPFFGD